MSVLSDRDIFTAIREKSLGIDPYNFWNVRSNHYDLRLGNTLRVAGPRRWLAHNRVDTKSPLPEDLFSEVVVPDGEGFEMLPGDFIIVTTKERLEFNGEFMGILTGRSSVGRLGIQVHSTAAHFDRGFKGYPNLEMSLVAPWSVIIYPGMRIASMIFHLLSSPCITPYGSQADAKYQDQGRDPRLSHIYLDWQ